MINLRTDIFPVLLTLVILSSFSFSACEGEITSPVVAVVGEGGGFVDVTIKVVPGSGEEYLGLLPYAGVSTQQSVKYAVDYARAISLENTSDCDVLVSFGELPTGEYVDGPSAGAAVTVLSYALFKNVPVRDDAIITGSIESGGFIGSVGGLYEKAKVTANNGKEYFITPYTDIFEYITLGRINEEYGIEILQANKIEDVIDFMIYDTPIPERNITEFESRISENTTPFEGLDAFSEVTFGMIDFENYTLKNMPASEENAWIRDYFNESMAEQLRYIELGYYFTAANDAFLNYVEISTINVVLSDDVDLREKEDEITECLDSLERPEMTSENFEWVVGSDLRKAWAADKLNSTDIQDGILIEDKYSIYNSLMYADAWCRVSGMLAEEAGNEGEKVNEDAWRELAQEKIEEADSYLHSDDSYARLEIAKNSYSEGRYGAAILDASYVIAMDNADFDLMLMSEEELNLSVYMFSRAERTSLWGTVYQSQGEFLLNQNEPNIPASYRLFLYASELDNSIGKMRRSIEMAESEEVSQEGLPWEEIALIFILLSFVLLFILPRIRRSYGSIGKGRGRVSGTKPKKARARTEKKLSRAKQKR